MVWCAGWKKPDPFTSSVRTFAWWTGAEWVEDERAARVYPTQPEAIAAIAIDAAHLARPHWAAWPAVGPVDPATGIPPNPPVAAPPWLGLPPAPPVPATAPGTRRRAQRAS